MHFVPVLLGGQEDDGAVPLDVPAQDRRVADARVIGDAERQLQQQEALADASHAANHPGDADRRDAGQEPAPLGRRAVERRGGVPGREVEGQGRARRRG
jgi:hypothetical protein